MLKAEEYHQPECPEHDNPHKTQSRKKDKQVHCQHPEPSSCNGSEKQEKLNSTELLYYKAELEKQRAELAKQRIELEKQLYSVRSSIFPGNIFK